VVAFRLTLVSDTSVDIAMLLRDVMMPLPMRDGWGPEMEWPYPGVPAAVVAEFAGHRVAGLPFFAPETVTTDHGGPYKSHSIVAAQRAIGCNILPARVLRPQDKAACERAFGALRTLLFEHLPGYAGVDVADRGADPGADAVLTMDAMERLIAEWVIAVWQARALGEHAPAWGPGGEHSPNTLFAAAMNQGGFALQVPRPELYYELLPAHRVKIHPQRGVKIGGLWYGRADPALKPYEGKLSDRGGQHKGEWVIRSDRRDRRQVFFQDPADPSRWHALRWNGLPPEGAIPAFSDKTADELLREARGAGLSPRTDADLLPVLLKLIGGAVPVSQWRTQMTRKEKTGRAREAAQGRSAAADWHLPVVFACTIHGRLLEHTCPACGKALNAGSARRRASLIACPDASGLHPHQCRNPAGPAEAGRRTPLCGGRLDRLAPSPPAPMSRDDLERMLRIQAEISQVLNQKHEGGTAGNTYFPDLLAAARLLILSWPHGSDAAGPHAITSLIDEHAGPARKSLVPGQDSTGQARYGRAPVNAWGPPGPPAQCGALILAAHSLIAGRNQHDFRDQVQNLANAAARTSQRAFWAIRNMDGLSHALRRALAPRGQGLRHAAAGARQFPPSRDCLFTIEEVPPHLPRKWYDDHLAALAARIAHPNSWTPRHLRRVASLKLAEMTAGGTWKQCARQLDIPYGAAERSVRVLRD
jgi:hypothetical protein